jgi:diguanylate cyclase (GGDEF)-like protein
LALVRAAMLGQPIPPQFDARLRHREGHVVIVELHVTVLPDGLQGTAREVTEIRALQAELAAQALHDPLTGLANRNLLHEVLTLGRQSAKRSGAPLALIYLDLDDFKAVNDSYGHEAGDVVLRETARRLLSTVREADVVARVGGDEFVVVHESSGDSTNLVVRRLEQALSEPIDVGNGVLVCCVPSMGIADALTVGRDPSALIAAADAAMYRVKRARRAEWCSAGVNTAGSGVDRGPPARGD